MTVFAQYKSLLKVIFKDTFKFEKFGTNKKKKIGTMIGVGLGLLLMVIVAISISIAMALGAINAGVVKEFLFVILGISQIIVLFFGMFAILSYLFFSKDNELLASLPLNTKAMFLAKFTMAYISEFFISTLVFIPMVTAYGITCITNGIAINAWYFIFEIVGVFLIPIIPLLLVSLLSMPIMYVVSFFKKRALSSGIASSLVVGVLMVLYFLAVNSFSKIMPENGEVALPAGLIAILDTIKKIMFFDAPLVNAMFGHKALLNIIIFIVGVGATGVITVLLASVFYKRALASQLEGSGSVQKKAKAGVSEFTNLKKSFMRKEIKTLMSNPMLMMSTFLGIIMGPLVVLFTTSMNGLGGSGVEGASNNMMFSIGMTVYIGILMASSTNQLAVIGFSREGQQLLVLKSLPISAEQMVRYKLEIATLVSIITAFAISLTFAIVNWKIAYLAVPIFAVIFTCSFGLNCFSLRSDLSNPNLKWKNATELTRNNKKLMKPMLLSLGLGFIYLILGMVLAFGSGSLKNIYVYLIYFSCCILPNIVLIYVMYKKLFENPQALLDRIEE